MRFENVCGESFSSLMVRVVLRPLMAGIKGRPSWSWAFGRSMDGGTALED